MTTNDLLQLLKGAVVSLQLAAGTIPFGTLLAILLVMAGTSRWTMLRLVYRGALWLVRGTPLVLLALLVFYFLNSQSLRVSPVVAGVLVLSIYFSVLFAEVLRGAFLAIPKSTLESAKSLGLPPFAMFRKVIAPLVLRLGLPGYINVCVMAIKGSSVLSIIGVWELTYAAREISERNLQVFQTLSVAAAIYFAICLSADRIGRGLEAGIARRGFAGHGVK